MLPEMVDLTQVVVARQVSLDDFMHRYAAENYEWVEGTVITMSPIHLKHQAVDDFLYRLLTAYLEETQSGQALRQPFVMIAPNQRSAREPDIQILLNASLPRLQATKVMGAADLVIEIVSPESAECDYVIKYQEYEQAGVTEYWIIDPHRLVAEFYHLENGAFQTLLPQAGQLHSRVLPRLRLPIAALWAEPYPNTRQILALVETMLKE